MLDLLCEADSQLIERLVALTLAGGIFQILETRHDYQLNPSGSRFKLSQPLAVTMTMSSTRTPPMALQ